ncbi:MAG TPA: sulfatase-like hydrolase/transferase [Vicinamibacterales bacterium]|nr:sulfatase-like hydrolase/transferase [Vicinamibacterales bacterium]
MKRRLLHLGALAGFAVAQPLYDVLRHSGEFFVAHRVDRIDVLLLVLSVSVVLPLALGLPVWIVSRASQRAASAVMIVLVGLLVALVALGAASHRTYAGPAELIAVAGVHGIVASLMYWQFASARLFLTVLSPAAIVFPLVFVLGPAMRPFVSPNDPTRNAAAVIDGSTPIVFVIFDQLPLTSLLDPSGGLDAHAFPGFAALAADAIWYRNASSTADFTGWAVPSLLSGAYPRPTALPIAADYPANLFTALGSRYRFEVIEPITHLCPQRLCPDRSESRAARQLSMLSDLSVVYARIVLPKALATGLPRLTNGWRDFISGQNWRRRWVTARDDDRRDVMKRLIASIHAGDPQPTLYFAHVLLPHEPYIYLSDGRQFTDPDMIGLGLDGVWASDPWFAHQTYRRHLLQVSYVDSLVGRLVDKLKQERLYDRALVVVTADHGVSFRHDQPWKGFRSATMADTVPVPLFVKPPHHTGAEVSDRNVQAIDVLPTVLDLVHARAPFRMAGVSAVGTAPAATEKRVYYAGASRTAHLPASLRDAVIEGAERKAAIFGGPSRMWEPDAAPFPALVGRPVSEVTVGAPSTLSLDLADAWRYGKVDLDADFIPARVSGRIYGHAAEISVPLAIAVNGTIEATTKSAGRPLPSAGTWAALVPPSALHDGFNAIDVFEIASKDGDAVLHRALHSGRRPANLNLVLGDAEYNWNVGQHGLYPREPFGRRWFRWTSGEADLMVHDGSPHDHATLRVALAPMTRPGTPLRITVNGCTVFDGTLPGGAWDHSFALSTCPPAARGSQEVDIRITSDHVRGPRGDPRDLGVPILAIELST